MTFLTLADGTQVAESIDLTPYHAADAVRERNSNREEKDETGRCPLCEAPLTAKQAEAGLWVHINSHTNEAFHESVSWDDPRSQGGFPVGPSCAKKIPAGYVVKIDFTA